MNGNQANVLRLLNEGKSILDIAKQLGISIKTVETHKSRLARKLMRARISTGAACSLPEHLTRPR